MDRREPSGLLSPGAALAQESRVFPAKPPLPLRLRLVEELWAILFLALGVVGFFWQPLFQPGYTMPKGGGDLASFLYPLYAFAARYLQEGIVPLWNPYQFGGMPFAADPQSGLFYPINLVVFLVARPFTYETMELLVVLHYFLAALFAYLYVRSLGLGRIPSVAAGLIFAFCGYMVARLGHQNTRAAAIWLPLILLFFHRALTRGSLKAALAAGLAYGVSILAGHLQISLYVALFLALYWGWALLTRSQGAMERAHPLRSAAALPITFGVAVGAAAVQLLPTLELMGLALRKGVAYEFSTQFAFSPLGFISLLVPHFFGRDATDYWGIPGSLTEAYGYVGVLPLFLALLALALPRRDGRWVTFFGLMALLFLLLSLGQSTVLHGWLYRFVPGFDRVRAPARFLVLFGLAAAVLAAYGLEQLRAPLARRARPRYRLFLWGATGAVALGLFGAAPFLYYALLTSQDKDPVIFQRIAIAIESLNLTLLFALLSLALLLFYRYRRGAWRIAPGLALALIVLDLFSSNIGFNPTSEDVTANFRQEKVLAFLRQDPEPHRIDTFTGVWDVWQPGLSLLEELPDAYGIFNPLALSAFDDYWSHLGSRSVPAYDLLNAKYLVAHKDVALDWKKYVPAFTEDPLVNVYRNSQALPRAFLVPGAQVLPEEEIQRRLGSLAFEPRRILLLSEAPGTVLPPAPAAAPDSSAVSVHRPNPNELLVRGSAKEPAYLLVSEVHYPGWRAWVNGVETEVLRADLMFRAVAVPSGAFVVHFRFLPWQWPVGAAVSGLTWVGSVALFFWGWRRHGE